ncbi:MAG: phosphoribosylglycinamide formyltransferase [Rhizobiales bacterium]|nr:phosphoribosylglycinamide formyltransferase [Hyphomicrobiales bacterium]MBN9010521.1 phosphoribosylglycinamide formyltransferase [Hyphomicrobiales bacterium]
MARKRVAILISGRGSNMEALIRAARDPAYPAGIVVVAADKPAAGLAIAAAEGIPTAVADYKALGGKAAGEAELNRVLDEAGTELICLAGFMRILSADFVQRWHDRLINIHPSLLPSYPGIDTHARALAAGDKVHGCTVHFVRAEVDTGPVILRETVPIRPGDTAETLARRVLEAEHRTYPRALALVASGQVTAASASGA